MAGSSLRCARSPVAPKIVNNAGSVAPPTRRPTRSGLSCESWVLTDSGRASLAHLVELLLNRAEQRVERGRERLHPVQLELVGDVVQRDTGGRQLSQRVAGL